MKSSIKEGHLGLKSKENDIKEAILLIQSLAQDILDEVATALVEVSDHGKE